MKVFGYRSKKKWKMFLASMVYGFILLVIIIAIINPESEDKAANTNEILETENKQTAADDTNDNASEESNEVVEPEPEPTPEPEPEPVPEAIVYTGSGDDVIKIDKTEDGPIMLYVKGNEANGHFAVTGYDANDNLTKLFVNTTEPYEAVTLDPGGKTTLLEVNASGSWTIESRSIRSARVLESPGAIKGTGDEVISIEGDPSLANIKGNTKEGHFAVMGYNPGVNLLVNTTDAYEGKVRVASGIYILEVTAIGDWEISLE